METSTRMDSLVQHNRIGESARQHDRILATLAVSPWGMTRRELAAELGIFPGTLAARANELLAAQRIREDGKRVCSISKKRVWVLKPHA